MTKALPTTRAHPLVAIVGRPNVGKSALFNRLAGRNIAIVHDRPGVTRDRLTAICRRGEIPFEIMDTGGIGETISDEFADQVKAEAQLAMESADVILFIVDGYEGQTPVDQTLAQMLRKSTKPVMLVVNKVDSERRRNHAAEFSRLGFKNSADVSAEHGIGVNQLADEVVELIRGCKLNLAHAEDDADTDSPSRSHGRPLRIAIVGRPNAGKSSLINAILGQQRTIVSDIAGTTRDSVDIPCEIGGRPYILIDTAGLRRKAKIQDAVESYSSGRAVHSLRRADICLLVVDSADGAKAQDRTIANLILKQQKPCIIVLNKFDLYHPDAKPKARSEELIADMRREFFFLPYAPMIPICAMKSQGVDAVFNSVKKVQDAAQNQPGTGALNRLLHNAVDRSVAALG
ncbi:MAG: ribosome biogenesis GTPase Der, partial [Verrucomicrobiaceae bacterium]